MKRTVLFLLVITLLAGGILFAYLYNKPHRAVDKAAFSILSEDLIKEFEEDENLAGERYIDEVLEVRGPVREVIEKNNSFILLLGSEASIRHVSCTLNKSEDIMAHGLQPGDRVIVKGICSGFLMDVILVNCHVISNP